MKIKPIYLDYMATTPIDPRVITAMLAYMGPDAHFGNSTTKQHVYGQEAARGVEQARQQIADVIHTTPEAIFFTSGATEANNLAILGAARFYQQKGRHAITMTTEHKAVLDPFQQLEREGFEITYLKPKSDGLLDLTSLAQAIRQDTLLVSIMHVNNEVGVIQDIAAIGKMLQGKGILFHVDAAQSAGKLPIHLDQLSVDLMSFSAHKLYGPKGIGALYIRQRPRVRLQPIVYGGGQEQGFRPGTLPTHQIVGMGEAFRLAEATRIPEQQHLLTLRNHLWDALKDCTYLNVNGSMTERIAGNLNLSIHGIDASDLFPQLHRLALSTTSACLSASQQPSYVLQELGLSRQLASNSLRLSLGRFTTEEDIEQTIAILRNLRF